MFGEVRFVRDHLAVCGFAGIGRREEFAARGFSGHLQCAGEFEEWIAEVCDVLAVPFIDGRPIPQVAFERAKEWIAPRWQRGEKVLISCAGGSSRSVSMASALLATLEGIPFRTAIDDVLAKIPGAYPHPITLASAARLAGEALTAGEMREIYAGVVHKPPYPWSNRLIEAATLI